MAEFDNNKKDNDDNDIHTYYTRKSHMNTR